MSSEALRVNSNRIKKNTAQDKNKRKLLILTIICLIGMALYMTLFVDFKYPEYALSTRTPKLMVMLIAAFCIGSASLVFQTVINNTIVTPCLLGLNSLYTLVQTSILFILGANSIFMTDKILSFTINLVVMVIASTMIYGYLFKKTKGNILFILLTGTIMSTLFTSISTTMQRMIDPSDYLVLQNKMIAGFTKTTPDILIFSVIIIAIVIFALKKELQVLDVISLGKHQAINLGVDYDKTIARLMIGIIIFISVATALVGPISFLGLIISNLSRNFLKTFRHSYLVLGSTMFGVLLLVFSQGLIEHVFSFSTTISVFINTGGGMYFMYLILKDRRN